MIPDSDPKNTGAPPIWCLMVRSCSSMPATLSKPKNLGLSLPPPAINSTESRSKLPTKDRAKPFT